MKDDEVKNQIILNISEDSFMILHDDKMDVLDVYLVLSAARDYLEDQAEELSRKQGSYLQ